jgi:hypothetical protein
MSLTERVYFLTRRNSLRSLVVVPNRIYNLRRGFYASTKAFRRIAFCIHLKVNVSLREGQERPGPPLTRQVLARLRSPCTELVLQEPSNYSHTLVPAVLKRFLIIFGSSYNINQKSSEKGKGKENKGAAVQMVSAHMLQVLGSSSGCALRVTADSSMLTRS